MPKLTQMEVNEFLQERGHLVRITTLNASEAPSVVPVWFVYEGGKILITPRKYSAFYADIQRAARGDFDEGPCPNLVWFDLAPSFFLCSPLNIDVDRRTPLTGLRWVAGSQVSPAWCGR
jgi:hypothetical protein